MLKTNSSNKAGFQAGLDFFPRHGGRRIALVIGKAGIKQMLLLGAQRIVAFDPVAFELKKLLGDALPLRGSETRNFLKDFSQTHGGSLIGADRSFNRHHLPAPPAPVETVS